MFDKQNLLSGDQSSSQLTLTFKKKLVIYVGRCVSGQPCRNPLVWGHNLDRVQALP